MRGAKVGILAVSLSQLGTGAHAQHIESGSEFGYDYHFG